LFDAFLVPKLLSQQLLLFRKSGDELEELTFEVKQFLPPSMRRGQSACTWRTVRGYSVLRMFIVFLLVFVFRSGFVLGFYCSQFADGPSFSSRRSRTRADGPPGLHGWSVFPGASLVVLVAFSDRPWHLAGLSAAPLRTVRGTWPDCPRGPCGQSAPSGRTVRQSLASLLLGSISPSFFTCFRVCFKESFLKLEVDP
jgi:hypothetical protein